MTIERRTLRSQIRRELLDRMRRGEIRPGENINEVQLAAELGVSRTPLREALIALESEGQIEQQDGKGFRFRPLSRDELRALAPILAALEGLAIELIPTDQLRETGLKLADAAAEFDQSLVQHALVIAKDDAWHETMIAACPNILLLGMIANTRRAIHRYESILVPAEAMIDRVAAEHALIASCLIAGDVAGAQAAVRDNWINGVTRTIDNADRAWLGRISEPDLIPSPPLLAAQR